MAARPPTAHPIHETRRHFTPDEANALVPHFERIFAHIDERRRELTRLVDELKKEGVELGAKAIDPDEFDPEFRHDVERVRELVSQIQRELRGIHDTGAEVKDLDSGLVDFYAMRGEDEVFLCWRRGEATVTWWHPVADGVAGRTAIDDAGEFLRVGLI